MAGHSQFKNIMHRKGRQDSVKSKLFSKLAREITVAAKLARSRKPRAATPRPMTKSATKVTDPAASP